MTKQQAFAESKAVWPAATPTRMSGCSYAGGAAIITSYEQPVSLCLYNETDLVRAITTCQMALAALRKKRTKRNTK
jgi:hypothetical protein